MCCNNRPNHGRKCDVETYWRCPCCAAHRVSIALAEELKLPPLKKQPSPQAVIDEHMDALNKCDWNRIMAQYPPDYQLNLPDGVVVKGQEEASKLFAIFVKPVQQGAYAA